MRFGFLEDEMFQDFERETGARATGPREQMAERAAPAPPAGGLAQER